MTIENILERLQIIVRGKIISTGKTRLIISKSNFYQSNLKCNLGLCIYWMVSKTIRFRDNNYIYYNSSRYISLRYNNEANAIQVLYSIQ